MNGEPLVLEPRLYTRNTKDDELVRAAVLPLEQLLGASIVVDAQSQLRVQAERQKAQAAQQAADNAMDALRRQPDGYGALAMEAAQARGTCTIGAVPQGKSEAQADAARHGVLATQAYRQWRGSNDDRFSGVFGDASSLYTALQRQSCQVAVGSGAELAPMAAALRRDGVAFTVMPAVVSMDEAEAAFAQSKGFASAADLKLAAAMGGLSPARRQAEIAARPYRITLTCRYGNMITYLDGCLSSGGWIHPSRCGWERPSRNTTAATSMSWEAKRRTDSCSMLRPMSPCTCATSPTRRC